MVKHEVREKLLTKLRISHQALSKRAKRLKEKHGPMTTDEAVYIVAHLEGIDLSRYLPLQYLDRIRSMIPRETREREFDRPAVLKPKSKQKKETKYITHS